MYRWMNHINTQRRKLLEQGAEPYRIQIGRQYANRLLVELLTSMPKGEGLCRSGELRLQAGIGWTFFEDTNTILYNLPFRVYGEGPPIVLARKPDGTEVSGFEVYDTPEPPPERPAPSEPFSY